MGKTLEEPCVKERKDTLLAEKLSSLYPCIVLTVLALAAIILQSQPKGSRCVSVSLALIFDDSLYFKE